MEDLDHSVPRTASSYEGWGDVSSRQRTGLLSVTARAVGLLSLVFLPCRNDPQHMQASMMGSLNYPSEVEGA